MAATVHTADAAVLGARPEHVSGGG